MKAKEAKATGRPADRNVFPLDGGESLHHSTTVPVQMTPEEAMQIATLNGRSVRRAPAYTFANPVRRPSAAAAASAFDFHGARTPERCQPAGYLLR